MAVPQLMSGGSVPTDTNQVYTSQHLAIGTVGVLGGRSYVWCSHTGSDALVRGEPLVAAGLNFSTLDMAITTNGLGIGQKNIVDITAGNAAIVADAFVSGFLVVTDGGGEGTIYEIERNTAFTASTADGTVSLLNDPIRVASDADTQVSLVRNKFADPQQSNSLGNDAFVGVPNVAVPAGDSTAQYFWAQRNGYCPVFVEGTPKRGVSVIISEETNGRVASVRQEIEVTESKSGGARSLHKLDISPVVGVMVTDAIDGEIQLVDLQNPIY